MSVATTLDLDFLHFGAGTDKAFSGGLAGSDER